MFSFTHPALVLLVETTEGGHYAKGFMNRYRNVEGYRYKYRNRRKEYMYSYRNVKRYKYRYRNRKDVEISKQKGRLCENMSKQKGRLCERIYIYIETERVTM